MSLRISDNTNSPTMLVHIDTGVFPDNDPGDMTFASELVKVFNYLFTLAPEEFLKKMVEIEKAISNDITEFELLNLIMPKDEEKEEVFKELLEWE